MIQRTKSEIHCGTLDSFTRNFNERIDDDQELRLYKVELAKYESLVSRFLEFLSPHELQRANNYYFIKDKNRFVICRTLLKFLLTEETGLDIEKIHLDKLSNKKPYLRSHPSVFFNVSHSGKHALIAISKDIVGVDIEHLNKEYEFMETLPQIFNKEEIDTVLNSDDKAYGFYKFWTRKEAIVKATGKGIDNHFIEIPAKDGLHLLDPKIINNTKKLNVFSFDVDNQHIAAIAFKGRTIISGKLPLYSIPLTLDKLRALNKK